MGEMALKIGSVEVRRTACLAPMAGVSDRAFRELCKELGAAYLIGEMASAKGLTYGQGPTEQLLSVTEGERPMAVQLFGSDPAVMAQAARIAMEYRPDVIDINMGCPAPKITGGGCGAALMKDPPLAQAIVEAVVRAVPVPVTVKFRKGWDETSVNAVEFARRLEAAGAAALAVHGRTRQQMYAPAADWSVIRRVKEAVSIPVIGNGDVFTALDCARMYEETGCDLVMIGRGAMGNPWIFREAEEYLTRGQLPAPPSLEERLSVLRRHVGLLCRYKGEYTGMREARSHAAWYLKGFPGAAQLRRQAGNLSSPEDLDALCAAALALAGR